MILNALEYTIKLILAAMLFMPRQKKIDHYWTILGLTAFAIWIINMGIDLTLEHASIAPAWAPVIHFSSSYLLILVVITLTHTQTMSEYLFTANTCFAILNAWHCTSALLLLLPGIRLLNDVTPIAESLVSIPFVIICWYGTREIRKREIPHKYQRIITALTFVILFGGFLYYEHTLNTGSATIAYLLSLLVSLVILFLQYGIKAFR